MKTLALALIAAGLIAGSTGCCCMGGGCSPCGGGGCYGGGCGTYGYAPAYGGGGCSSCGTGYAAPGPMYGGGCPNGNCGPGGAPMIGPQGAYYGPSDVMSASAWPTPVAATPTFGPTAMVLDSLPTY